MLHGWDPINLLSLTGTDRVVAQEVVRTMNDIEQEREQHRMKAMQIAVQNGVARAFKGKG